MKSPTALPAAASPAAAVSALPPIQCVVVLMLENRSFDHIFGTWPGASGLNQGPFSNRPNPAVKAGAPGNKAISAYISFYAIKFRPIWTTARPKAASSKS